MSVEKQNFISRAYSRVFVGLFLDWVSNGMKAKDLDCFSDACILVEGGIEGVLKKLKNDRALTVYKIRSSSAMDFRHVFETAGEEISVL